MRVLFSTVRAAAVLPLLLIANGTVAQDASKYYTVVHPDEFKTDWTGFYKQADATTAAVRARVRHQLDIPYGAGVKQRLDLYFPAKMAAGAPVFLFLHGGGFREGDRAQYGFVAQPFADSGVISAIASYRLTGEGFKYPAQRDDARLAVLWLYRNIKRYGGDPEHVYIGGHSSGAILVADLGVDRAWLEEAGVPKGFLRAIVPISGSYDLRTPGNPEEATVFWSGYTPTAQLRAQASPLLHIVDPAPVALVIAGSTEREGYDNYVASSEAFVARLVAKGTQAQFLSLAGAGHRDTVLALGDELAHRSNRHVHAPVRSRPRTCIHDLHRARRAALGQADIHGIDSGSRVRGGGHSRGSAPQRPRNSDVRGDFPLVRPNGVIDFDARYLLEADDGTIIYMQNRGYRWGSPEVMERLSRNEPVRPDEYHMRAAPKFEAPEGPH